MYIYVRARKSDRARETKDIEEEKIYFLITQTHTHTKYRYIYIYFTTIVHYRRTTRVATVENYLVSLFLALM